MSRRPSPDEIAAARGATVRDVIGPDLEVVFCGINPSLYSAAVGHHFARPGNRFWKALYLGGFTPRIFTADEGHLLLRLGAGITNIHPLATARADEVTPDQLRQGVAALDRKLDRYRTRCLAVLGLTAYRAAFADRHAGIGPQDRIVGGARVWLLPNPSGLNAHHQVDVLGRLFAELRAGIANVR